LEQRNLRRAQVLKKGSQPIMDYYDEFYTATVTVGTPGQNVSLLLDTSMSILWVIDAKCGTGACNGYLGSVYTRRKYNASKSSTVSPYRNTTNLLYPSGWLTGPVVKDTVSFAGLTIEQQGFVNAADISDAFGFMPLDGFLGLSWQQSSDVVDIDILIIAKSPMENLLPSLDAPIFTVWLDRKAISDTSSSWIGAPFRVMNEVVSQTGALFDYENEMYTVNCSTMMQQPDLEFIINGIKYTLPSKEYIVDIELGEGKASYGAEWILGTPWIRTYCNIHDFGQARIGFAKAKHSE
uniref:Peptidase A1 domain-containing protein n=1 Tax=Angiostrongylus cantonensis TaxID=6313 RepID=A0A0K0DK16_ANGCA